MRSQQPLGWMASLALVVSACTVESTGMTEGDLALLLAEQECAWHLSVGCSEPAWSDEASCIEQRSAQLRQAYAEAEALGRRFDSACAEEIIGPSGPFGCASVCSVFIGDKRLGEACREDGPGSDCGFSLLCVEGTCVDSTVIAPAAEGEPCVDEAGQPARPCRTGLYCDSERSGTCMLGPATGEACIDGVRCGTGSFCDVDDGVCQPERADGEPCESPSECDSFSCEAGVCVARDPFWCTNDEFVYTVGCLEPI